LLVYTLLYLLQLAEEPLACTHHDHHRCHHGRSRRLISPMRVARMRRPMLMRCPPCVERLPHVGSRQSLRVLPF
jgi:hypothetical protein